MTNDQKTMDAEDFITSRPELSDKKKTIIRYCESISDVFWIEPHPKGRSRLHLEFDCGAYKGSEIVVISLSNCCPLEIAASLESLTCGHHFNCDETKDAVLKKMETRIAGAQACNPPAAGVE